MKIISFKHNIEYLTQIQSKIHDASIVEQNRIQTQDFTRDRKLTMPIVIAIELNKSQHSLAARISHTFEILGAEALENCPSTSAFSQARMKMNPRVFLDLLDYSNTLFYQNLENHYDIQRWHGKLLLAVDASRIDIPEINENEASFSRIRSINLTQGVLQGNISALYDVLNKLPLNIDLGKVQSEKIPVFQSHIPFLKSGLLADYLTENILLFDRGYADYGMLAMLISNNLLFCLRCKTSCTFKNINQFMKSPKKDTLITFKVTTSQQKFVIQNNLPSEITIRAVKVILPTGETEVLLTNLMDKKEYPTFCFQQLYFKRWGIETAFFVLKSWLGIEKFSSDKLQCVLQDIYSKIFLFTVCEMIKKVEDRQIKIKCLENKTKFEYQASISQIITVVQEHVIELLFICNNDLKQVYSIISKWIQAYLSPIRPNRSHPRPKRSDSQRFVYSFTKKRQHS